MDKLIKTFDVEKWSKPDEQHRVKKMGMVNAKETFDKLEAHLKYNGLLPDEYFLFNDINGELPEFTQAFCHTNFGGSEGIYIDILLERESDGKFIRFATGKTLGETADDFYKMSRIAAECSLMLNGNGREYTINQEPTSYRLNYNETTDYVIVEQQKNIALLKRFIKSDGKDPTPYIVAYGIEFNNDLISWQYGEYRNTLEGAYEEYQSHFHCEDIENENINEYEDELVQ